MIITLLLHMIYIPERVQFLAWKLLRFRKIYVSFDSMDSIITQNNFN